MLCNNELDVPILLDVTPLKLGIEVIGGLMSGVVEKNTKVPCRVTRSGYTTVKDYQKCIDICIYQGQRDLVAENQNLGNFTLENIKYALKGEPKVSVTFDINESGLMNVSAFDEVTGGQNQIEINFENYKLNEEEIQGMLEVAREMEAFDQQERSRIEAMLSLQDTIYYKKRSQFYSGANKNRVDEIETWLNGHKNAPKEQFDNKKDQLMNLLM
eukprot:TRINITY_DN23208_c0_g1_i1.p1 TRINITY_DN23208_c0_g1~~TRINITY_DN23208_c0_g1_i1.p1  ORF type:complete len:214 (+),score=28.80 TRINITY_DN23208_c0_g1_i1:101-742(+)